MRHSRVVAASPVARSPASVVAGASGDGGTGLGGAGTARPGSAMGGGNTATGRRAPVAAPRPVASLLLATALAATLGGCSLFSSPDVIRGNPVSADELHELIPGTSSRADATALLGSPTAHATFDDNVWVYVGQYTRSRVARLPGVDKQDVVVLTFNQAGILQSVRHLTKKDARPVTMVARTTPSPGSEASFLQQLLGNVGRFTPGGLGTSSTNSTGSSGNSLPQ